MRVCILHRPNATSGGDYVALNGYAGALQGEKKVYKSGLLGGGIEVELRSAATIGDLSTFDYVHLWAACSPDWGLPAAREVKRQNKKLVITPFWWSRAERQTHFGRPGMDLIEGYTPAVGETLRLADILFPVTMSEAVECWKLAPSADVWTVPMGIDKPSVEAIAPMNYVLCVGRIEPHKNQLMLAQACRELGYDLILVGQTTSEGYTRQVIEASGNRVNIVTDLDRIKREIMLSAARVHALPSFFENPGLVHGEALAMGIPAVAGSHGCEPEFYREALYYCDPTSLDSIKTAIELAWAVSVKSNRLGIVDLPTWYDAAKRAKHGYSLC